MHWLLDLHAVAVAAAPMWGRLQTSNDIQNGNQQHKPEDLSVLNLRWICSFQWLGIVNFVDLVDLVDLHRLETSLYVSFWVWEGPGRGLEGDAVGRPRTSTAACRSPHGQGRSVHGPGSRSRRLRQRPGGGFGRRCAMQGAWKNKYKTTRLNHLNQYLIFRQFCKQLENGWHLQKLCWRIWRHRCFYGAWSMTEIIAHKKNADQTWVVDKMKRNNPTKDSN